jgi:metal-sulfur cluster biosynthetic enzyme
MGISVTELGLIYGIEREQDHVEVTMTLTSPGCPVAPEIMAAVHRATLSVEDVESVHVNLTFSPLWNPRIHATEDAQMELGVF